MSGIDKIACKLTFIPPPPPNPKYIAIHFYPKRETNGHVHLILLHSMLTVILITFWDIFDSNTASI